MQKYLYDRRPYVWLANDDSVAAVSKNWNGCEHAAGAVQRAQHRQPDHRAQEVAAPARRPDMRGADYFIKRVAFAIVTVFVAITINFSALPARARERRHEPRPGPARDAAAARRAEAAVRARQVERRAVRDLPQAARAREPRGLVREPAARLAQPLGPLKNTIPMVLLGTFCSIVFGTLTGVLAAWRRGSGAESVSVMTALAFYSMPTHWLGLTLVILFAGVLPTGGMSNDFLNRPVVCDPRQGPRRAHPPAVADPRARALRRVHADRALGLARDARRGLHPHCAREGAEVGDLSGSTRCGTRCCRS